MIPTAQTQPQDLMETPVHLLTPDRLAFRLTSFRMLKEGTLKCTSEDAQVILEDAAAPADDYRSLADIIETEIEECERDLFPNGYPDPELNSSS